MRQHLLTSMHCNVDDVMELVPNEAKGTNKMALENKLGITNSPELAEKELHPS